MAEAMQSADETWHRRVAAQCNNAAWDLIEKSALDSHEIAELVRLASAASYHWRRVGASASAAHADLLFAWAMARAGAGPVALDAASRSLSYFMENQSEDWELAFAHAAMAMAFYCNGDSEGYKRHHQTAKDLADVLQPEEASIFLEAFRSIPM